MRNGPKVNKDWSNVDFSIDWKATPVMVLEEVNDCLKQHGLEFVRHATDSDQYAFSLKPVKVE